MNRRSACPKLSDRLLASCVSTSLQKHMGKRLSEVAKEMSRSPDYTRLDLVEVRSRPSLGRIRACELASAPWRPC